MNPALLVHLHCECGTDGAHANYSGPRTLSKEGVEPFERKSRLRDLPLVRAFLLRIFFVLR
jgi:hypothetical protein